MERAFHTVWFKIVALSTLGCLDQDSVQRCSVQYEYHSYNPSCAERPDWSEHATCVPVSEPQEGAPYTDWSDCLLQVRFSAAADGSDDCPWELYAGWSESEKARYLELKKVDLLFNADGSVNHKSVYCAVPMFEAQENCEAAMTQAEQTYADRAGWYSCEDPTSSTLFCGYVLGWNQKMSEVTHGNLFNLFCRYYDEWHSDDACE